MELTFDQWLRTRARRPPDRGVLSPAQEAKRLLLEVPQDLTAAICSQAVLRQLLAHRNFYHPGVPEVLWESYRAARRRGGRHA